MKVLITGANGLLATNTMKAFSQAGIPVRGLLRDKCKFVLPTGASVEVVEGDIRNRADLISAMDGCTHVIHIAALTSQSETKENYREVNVLGTENVLEAAIRLGIQRVVMVSTANTFGYGDRHRPGDEQQPMKFPFTDSLYSQSKREADQLVDRYRDLLDVVTVHPSFMIGAFDAGPSSGKIITMALNKKIVFYPPGGKNFVHVSDVATGILKALAAGRRNEHYLLTGENLTYLEFYQKLIQRTGQKSFLVPLPKMLLIGLGRIGEILRVLGVRSSLSMANMQALCIGNYYGNKKAREHLGVAFTPIEIALDEALEWFEKTGIVNSFERSPSGENASYPAFAVDEVI